MIVNNILKNFEDKFLKINSKEELQNLKSEFFGKNGLISAQFKKMGTLSESEKISFAKELNNLKSIVTSKIDNKFKDLESDLINEKLKGEKIDVTLPTRSQLNGKIHPVSQVIDEISSIFF